MHTVLHHYEELIFFYFSFIRIMRISMLSCFMENCNFEKYMCSVLVEYHSVYHIDIESSAPTQLFAFIRILSFQTLSPLIFNSYSSIYIASAHHQSGFCVRMHLHKLLQTIFQFAYYIAKKAVLIKPL